MNREIKFRAWNTGKRMKHGMHDWETLIDSLLGEINPKKSLFAGFFLSEQFKENPWITLMQYTGFQDCQSKGIYDGDILLSIDADYPYKATVCWDVGQGAWYLRPVDEEMWIEDWNIGDDCYRFSVIGNIYENPELLNK